MAGLPAVRGRVLALGVVAAADVPADLAHPQVHPSLALRQALLAALDLVGEVEVLDLADVGAAGRTPTLAQRRTQEADICKGAGMAGGEPITKQGLEDLRAELADLEGPRRQAMAARIKVAREEGDLKENAEYHVAKEDQAHLETRIKRLRERLQNAVVVESTRESEDSFSFGRTAQVLDQSKGEVNTWTLVGSTEADLAAGRLSAESPIGRGLLDAKLGKPVKVETPGGARTFVVQKLV